MKKYGFLLFSAFALISCSSSKKVTSAFADAPESAPVSNGKSTILSGASTTVAPIAPERTSNDKRYDR